MNAEITFHGQLADITGCTSDVCTEENVDQMLHSLYTKYPGLASSRFITAIGTRIAVNNEQIINGDRIALLPPFAGG